jgi:hypothetical protein
VCVGVSARVHVRTCVRALVRALIQTSTFSNIVDAKGVAGTAMVYLC